MQTVVGKLTVKSDLLHKHLLKMGRKKGKILQAAEGLKHGGVEKTSKLNAAKQASITGFLMAQREPLGEIRTNFRDNVKDMANDAPSKENVKGGELIEKKKVTEEMNEEEDPEMVGLSEYEKIRLRNIRQREALFAELALQVAFWC